MTTDRKLRICMLVVDSNEVRGLPPEAETCISPVLHTAMHNLLTGLRHREDLEIEVVYGRKNPKAGEDRRDGSLRYIPLQYKELAIPGMGGAYVGRSIALLKHIRRSRPDIVHAQGTERESGLVAAICGRPSLLTLHGNFREIFRSLGAKPFSYLWVNAILEKWIIPKVRGVICISNYTKRLIQELNPHNWVLPNAVNPEMFTVVNSPVKGRVVCLATIDPRKNQIAFMRAADTLAARFSHFHVHFWGSIMEDTSYAQEFRKALDTRPWATYCGAAEIDSIAQILSETDILVLPSIEDNCPVVILEAMAAGVPVVASDVGGIPDLVSHGKTGFMAPPEDQPGLVGAVQRLLEEPVLRDELSKLSKIEASLRFKPEKIAEVHAQIYREVIGIS